jgi:predicted  nucleic acid-binding Zn-ribbon protein
MSETCSERRKMNEMKVLELHGQGLSYRTIASLVHLSLRDIAKYVHRISNKTKSPSRVSVMDEVILEYRLNLLRSEVRGLKEERDNLRNEVNDLCTRVYDLQNQLHARQIHLDVVKMDLENERFSKDFLKDIFD